MSTKDEGTVNSAIDSGNTKNVSYYYCWGKTVESGQIINHSWWQSTVGVRQFTLENCLITDDLPKITVCFNTY